MTDAAEPSPLRYRFQTVEISGHDIHYRGRLHRYRRGHRP